MFRLYIIYTFLFVYNTVVQLTQFLLWTPTTVLVGGCGVFTSCKVDPVLELFNQLSLTEQQSHMQNWSHTAFKQMIWQNSKKKKNPKKQKQTIWHFHSHQSVHI